MRVREETSTPSALNARDLLFIVNRYIIFEVARVRCVRCVARRV